MLYYVYEDGTILCEEDMAYDYSFLLETVDFREVILPDEMEHEEAYTILSEVWSRR